MQEGILRINNKKINIDVWPQLCDGSDTSADLHGLFLCVLTNVQVFGGFFACFSQWWSTILHTQYSSVLAQVPSNLTSVASIHQELPTWKSTHAHFVLLLPSLQFRPFVQPVKPSWLINIMLCVPHTAGFSRGSCPVSEKLTYGHSSRGVAGTKCSSSSLHTPASHGVPRWSEESNWQPCCHPHRQACRPQLPSVSTGNLLYGKLGVLNHEVHSRCWSAVTEQRRCFSNIGAEFPV